MRRKPTNLSLSKEVVDKADELAKAQNKSLSRLIEDLLIDKLNLAGRVLEKPVVYRSAGESHHKKSGG